MCWLTHSFKIYTRDAVGLSWLPLPTSLFLYMFVYDSGGLTGCRQAHTFYSVALSYPLYFVCMHGWWRASLVLHSRVNVFRLMDGVWYSAAGIVVMFESCVWGQAFAVLPCGRGRLYGLQVSSCFMGTCYRIEKNNAVLRRSSVI